MAFSLSGNSAVSPKTTYWQAPGRLTNLHNEHSVHTIGTSTYLMQLKYLFSKLTNIKNQYYLTVVLLYYLHGVLLIMIPHIMSPQCSLKNLSHKVYMCVCLLTLNQVKLVIAVEGGGGGMKMSGWSMQTWTAELNQRVRIMCSCHTVVDCNFQS